MRLTLVALFLFLGFSLVNAQCGTTPVDFTYSFGTNSLVLAADSNNYPVGSMYGWRFRGFVYGAPDYDANYSIVINQTGDERVCLDLYDSSKVFCDSLCRMINIPDSALCSTTLKDTFFTTNYYEQYFFRVDTNNNPPGTVYKWYFGNSTNDSLITTTGQIAYTYPVQVYNGHYNVKLEVTLPGTSCFNSSQRYVGVPGTNAPNCYTTLHADISNPLFLGGVFGDTLLLSAVNPNYNPIGVVYSWLVNGVVIQATTNSHFKYLFPIDTIDKYYQIQLRVTLPGTVCLDVDQSSITIVAGTHVNCKADFSFSQDSVTHQTHFTDLSSGSISTTQWYHTDPNGVQSSNMNLFTTEGVYTVCLRVQNSNGCKSLLCDSVFIEVPPVTPDTICGYVFDDANSNGVKDNGENYLSNINIVRPPNGITLATSDANGFYQVITSGQSATSIRAKGSANCIPTLPYINGASYGSYTGNYFIPVDQNASQCIYNFGLNCNAVSICGEVFLDGDNNAYQTAGEESVAGIRVTLTDSLGNNYVVYTNSSGYYCINVAPGKYVIKAESEYYSVCEISPAYDTLYALQSGQVYNNNNDFAIYCIETLCNLDIDVTPQTTVTPGFPAWYNIEVRNTGSMPLSGHAVLKYDSALHFDYALGPGALVQVDSIIHELTFIVPSLGPGITANYFVAFTVSQTLALNTEVLTIGRLSENWTCNLLDSTDNRDTLHQIVTGSWDPNNKLAYVTNYKTNPAFQWISSIDANQRIEYVINFQNEGNGPAVNVVVKDMISNDLDINSFELIGTSHDCQVTLNGNHANFKFSNIMLPAKVTDEPRSHGFVKFAINAVSNLPAGHIIADDAAIYFDFNTPVITNESEVTLLEPTGINEVSNVTATIAPNPMNQYATIRLNSNSNDGFKLRVTDITGRIVSEQITSSNNLVFERNSLSAGMYTYQIIQNNKAVAKGKLVIQF